MIYHKICLIFCHITIKSPPVWMPKKLSMPRAFSDRTGSPFGGDLLAISWAMG